MHTKHAGSPMCSAQVLASGKCALDSSLSGRHHAPHTREPKQRLQIGPFVYAESTPETVNSKGASRDAQAGEILDFNPWLTKFWKLLPSAFDSTFSCGAWAAYTRGLLEDMRTAHKAASERPDAQPAPAF